MHRKYFHLIAIYFMVKVINIINSSKQLTAYLKESLNAGAAVLGTATIIAMREKQHKTTLFLPFGLSTGNKRVDNDLRAVEKITELSLPDT